MNDELQPILLAAEFLPMVQVLTRLHARSGGVSMDHLETAAVLALYQAIQTRKDSDQPFWLHAMQLIDRQLSTVRLSAKMAALN